MKYGITNDPITQSVAEAVKHVLQREGESQYTLATEGKMKELHALMAKGMKDSKEIAKELGLADTKEVHDAISELIKKETYADSKLDQDVVDLHVVNKHDDPEQKKQTESTEISEAVDNFFGFPTKDKLVQFQSMAKKLKIKPISNPTVMKRGGNEFHVMGFEGSVRDIEKAMKVANDLYNEAVKIGEELSPKQKKIDLNKNGKVDGDDLAQLRKKSKKEDVNDNAEDAIKANDAETKKTLPKQTKVESVELEEGKFDKLQKKLGRINPETLGDVMDGKIKLNPAEKKEFDEFMKGVRKMFASAESTEIEESAELKEAANFGDIEKVMKWAKKNMPGVKLDISKKYGTAFINLTIFNVLTLRLGGKKGIVVIHDDRTKGKGNATEEHFSSANDVIKYVEKKYNEMPKDESVADNAEDAIDSNSKELQKSLPKQVKESTYSEKVISDILEKKNLEEATDLFDKGKISLTRFSMGKGKLGLQINYGMKYIQVPEKEINTLLTGLNTAFKNFKKGLGESIEEITEETFNMFFDGYDSDWHYLKQDAKKMRAKLTNIETQFGDEYYFTMDTTKSNLKKLLKKYGDLELEESVNEEEIQEAIQPGVFIKGGSKKVSKDEVEDILGRILFNPRLQKTLEKSKPFQAGKDSKGKGKNPYKTDTLDFHHFELGAMEGSMG